MTALRDAFTNAGLNAADAAFDLAIARYLNNGGTIERARQRLDRAAGKLRGTGQKVHADEAVPCAPAPQHPSGGGHRDDAQNGQWNRAAAQPNEPEAGHILNADKAKEFSPAPVPRPRANPPGVTIESLRAVRHVTAKSLFDSYRLPDGRSLRQVHWGELPALARTYRRHSRVLALLHNRVSVTDTALTVDQVVKEADVQDAINQAERFNDVA